MSVPAPESSVRGHVRPRNHHRDHEPELSSTRGVPSELEPELVCYADYLVALLGDPATPEVRAHLRTLFGLAARDDEEIYLAALDWLVHVAGPAVLRDHRAGEAAQMLNELPMVDDLASIHHAANACALVTFATSGEHEEVFRAGHLAASLLIDLRESVG